MLQFTPKRILAAVDFSELSTWALRHAVLWAQRCEAELVVLHAHAVPPLTGEPYLAAYDLVALKEMSREAARGDFHAYVRQHVPPELRVSCEWLTGPPVAVIQEYVSAGHVDLVVMGTHGRGGLSRLLLGSVAERTLRAASEPILIVRGLPVQAGRAQGHSLEEAAPAGVPHLRHILCPVNETVIARQAFRHACSVAATFGARLTPVYVVEPTEEDQSPRVLRRLEERLACWVPRGAPAGDAIQPVVRHGNPAEQVVTLARELKADLVVIGAQHRPFVDSTVLGVTTVRVTRHAPCPVLVVPRTSAK